jgi:hypothetical protein
MDLMYYQLSTSSLLFASTPNLSLPIIGRMLHHQQISKLNSYCNFWTKITKNEDYITTQTNSYKDIF